MLLLQKTVRSVQLHLHFAGTGGAGREPAGGPRLWCEARLKLKHTAFVELNERAILDVAYGGQNDFAVRRWRGQRLIGIDSSLVRLPAEPRCLSKEIRQLGQVRQPGRGRGPASPGAPVGADRCAQPPVLHTLFVRRNRASGIWCWPICRTCSQGISACWTRALLPMNCGRSLSPAAPVCLPLSAQPFSAINQLFADDQAGRSVGGHAGASPKKRAAVRHAGLPATLTLRLVTVRLATGVEVLATNLLDETLYPTAEFGELYHHRWGIETYYGLVKGRLVGELRSLSAEAVRQDVQATVFISNLESLLTRPAQEELRQPPEPLSASRASQPRGQFSCAQKPHHPTAAEPGADGPGLAQTPPPVPGQSRLAPAEPRGPAPKTIRLALLLLPAQHQKKRLLNRNSLTEWQCSAPSLPIREKCSALTLTAPMWHRLSPQMSPQKSPYSLICHRVTDELGGVWGLLSAEFGVRSAELLEHRTSKAEWGKESGEGDKGEFQVGRFKFQGVEGGIRRNKLKQGWGIQTRSSAFAQKLRRDKTELGTCDRGPAFTELRRGKRGRERLRLRLRLRWGGERSEGGAAAPPYTGG